MRLFQLIVDINRTDEISSISSPLYRLFYKFVNISQVLTDLPILVNFRITGDVFKRQAFFLENNSQNQYFQCLLKNKIVLISVKISSSLFRISY